MSYFLVVEVWVCGLSEEDDGERRKVLRQDKMTEEGCTLLHIRAHLCESVRFDYVVGFGLVSG